MNTFIKIVAALGLIVCPGAYALGQTDSVTNRLNEVAVVGIKQQSSTDLSASTSIDAKAAEQFNVQSMKGMSEIAPNFFIPEYGSRMTSSVYVRGIGARTEHSAVGLNVDGVPFLSKDCYDFDLMDIANIEVFRGPQALLNGRNAIGGQINIRTLSPWQYRGFRAMAEYGRFNSVRGGLGWYGLISPMLATSFTAQYHGTEGAYTNAYNGGKVGSEKSGSVRWKLSYHPASLRLTVSNVLAAGFSRQGGYPYEQVGKGQIAYNDTCFYRRNTVNDAITVGWAGKRVIVNSITSMQYVDDNMTLDQDFTPADYFTLTQRRHEWALTQDLFAKGRRGTYNWLGGVFGFYRHSRMSAPVTFKDTGISELIEKHPNQMNPTYPIRWDDREFVLGSDFGTFTRGIAFYHESRYRAGEFLFEGGLRFDLEHVSMSYLSHCNTGYTILHVAEDNDVSVYKNVPVVISEDGHLSHTYRQLLPKVAVAWEPKSAVAGINRVYMSVSKGYKAGGFNTQMFSDVLQQRIMSMMGIGMTYDVDKIVSYRPEQSWNFEIGTHAATSNHRLSADLTLFLVMCRDLQLTMFPSGNTTGRITTNAGRTRNMGVEASVKWSPLYWLHLRGDYGYTRAVFRRYFNGIADYRGKIVPYAPENTLFLSANFTPNVSVAGGNLEIETYMRGVGRIWWNEANTVSQPFYATLGASVSIEKPRWTLKLWGENLTNTRYNTFYFVSMSREFLNRALPLTFGATLRLNLGE